MWRCHHYLFEFLASGYLPRMSRPSLLFVSNTVIKSGKFTDVLVFTLWLVYLDLSMEPWAAKSFMLVWQRHHFLSRILPNGHFPRVTRLSRLLANDRVINPGLCTDLLAFSLRLVYLDLSLEPSPFLVPRHWRLVLTVNSVTFTNYSPVMFSCILRNATLIILGIIVLQFHYIMISM